jgi:hypothetical protein
MIGEPEVIMESTGGFAFPVLRGHCWTLLDVLLVELSGIEPLTSSLRTRRSPS